jgi:hypothetical protein
MEGAASSRIGGFEGELPLLPPTHGPTCHPLDPYFLLPHDAWLLLSDEKASPATSTKVNSRTGRRGPIPERGGGAPTACRWSIDP